MLHRRDFIRTISIVSSFLLICMTSCKKAITSLNSYGLTSEQSNLLEEVHNHLFPKDNASPGASDINSVGYIKKILKDPQIRNADKKLILYGINWIEETAQEMFQQNFIGLSYDEKEDTLKNLSKFRNGKTWISKNISFILEALLSDPIYGSNTNEVGWNWLKHKTGYPRPNSYTKYQYL